MQRSKDRLLTIMSKHTYLLCGMFIIFHFTCATAICPDDTQNDDFSKSHIGLVISPIKTDKVIREIEIYWNHPKFLRGDTIKLYKQESNKHFQNIYTYALRSTNGIVKSGVQADYVSTKELTFQKQCLKYHVALIRNNTIMKKNCLLTEPNWMTERRNILGNRTLNEIFLPGTHDSAAYSISKEPGEVNFIDNYIITQDEDILAQLIYGARYLDIRVGHYPLKETKWWANHGLAPVVPLQTVIDDVKTFLNNTQEIVVFDVQGFPIGFGLGLNIHDNLVEYLVEQFADYLVPRNFTWAAKLEGLWASGRRLIIGYDQRKVVSRHNSVLPSVVQEWGNVQSPEDLYSYLNKVETAALSSVNLTPRAAMAELTPKAWDVIWDRLGGLRKMAESVDINITTWYNTMWYDSANIVAADFIRGSGIIEVAIDWNDRRFSVCNES